MEVKPLDLNDPLRPASVTGTGDYLHDSLSAANFSDALTSFALQIRLVMGAHQCAISYLPTGGLESTIHRRSFSDRYSWDVSPDFDPTHGEIWDLVLREKKAVRMNEPEFCSHPIWRAAGGPGDFRRQNHFPMRGWLAAPVLAATGQILGVVQLSDKADGAEFTAADLDLLVRLTQLVLPTFQLHHANQELEKSAERIRVEEAVATSGQMLRLIMDNIPQGVFWKDRQSRYLGCNQVVARAFGVGSPASIVGLDDYRLPGLTPEQADHFIAHDRIVMENNQAKFGIIERATLADGTTIWMETNKIPMHDAHGAVVGVLGTWQDITERKRAEEALEESEERFRAVVDHAADGIFIHSSSGFIVDANRAACESLGYTRNELSGMSPCDLDPDLTQEKLEALSSPLTTGEKVTFETLHRRKDGTTFPVEIRLGALPMGGSNYGLSIARDITERTRAEKEIRSTSTFRETIIRIAAEGICVCFPIPDYPYLSFSVWNDQMTEITGYTMAEINCLGWLDTVFPDLRVREQAIARLARMREGDELRGEEWEITRKDGERRTVSISTSRAELADNTEAIVAIMHDVTRRKRAEEALRESEERLRAVIDHSPGVAVQWFDREGRVVLWNSASESMFGFSADVAVGKTLDQLIHTPEEYRVFLETLATIGETGTSISPTEYTFRRRNGENGVCLSTLFRIPGPNDSDWFVCMDVDITERKQTELALHESQDRFREVVEAVPVSLLMVDEVGKIILLNEQTERTFGYSRDELLGRSIELLVPASIRHLHSQYRRSFLDNPRHQIIGRDRDLAANRKDGTEFPVEVRLAPVPTGEGMHVLAAVVDITASKRAEEERFKLESQVRHAQKLESLGVLAGGIAHDFNNLLTGILGYTELAKMALPPDSAAFGHINEAVKGALRAAELTQQMLAYAGKGRLQIQPLCLSAVVKEMGRLLEISISKKCILQYHFAPSLPACQADAVQLRQIIMNLIINASEAIGDQSGVISVNTGIQDCDRGSLSDAYLDDKLPEGRYVFLEVADTGCGMSEETRAKLFDPFFTTKFTGRGLGLAAVLGIVRGHRAAIKVDSQVGKGTSFKVLFPATTNSTLVEPVQTNDGASWRDSGLVLIIDDEESVRGLTQHMLESLGFIVMTAADGREGVEMFRMESERIRLVILDMTMPHLDGGQVFREMQLIRAGVPTVLCSGYNEQTATDLFGGKGRVVFVQKPFQFQQLAAAVYKALQTRTEPN